MSRNLFDNARIRTRVTLVRAACISHSTNSFPFTHLLQNFPHRQVSERKKKTGKHSTLFPNNKFNIKGITLFSLQWAEKFQSADRIDFRVLSLLASMADFIKAGTAPTSRRICLDFASARQERFRSTLAVT